MSNEEGTWSRVYVKFISVMLNFINFPSSFLQEQILCLILSFRTGKVEGYFHYKNKLIIR